MNRTFTLLFLIVITSAGSLFAQNCIGPGGQVKWSYWANFAVQGAPDITDLSVLENYPDKPDGTQILGSLRAPVNYSDYFIGMIRGFIKVQQTETYLFNITSDDKGTFFLSTDQSPANKVKIAEVTSATGTEENGKEAGQTSAAIQLKAGQYYYFEAYNFEASGADHLALWWKKASNPAGAWSIIDFNNINEYNCGQACPPRGTLCNDGNALTKNDQQDGFCNCVGVAPTANACVGERGLAEAYYYDNIKGSYVENDLVNSPKFPLSPDRKEKLKGAFGPIPTIPIYASDNYGAYVQGFITVPVSGNYEFNVTGDNQTIFYLSKNDSIEFKQTYKAVVMQGVDETEHNNAPAQTIGPVYMQAGKYYYYEIRNKENNGRDHFNVYWKTPFYKEKVWKRIPAFYLFDYKCELACIAQGTPCDDGNPYTNNDKINGICECVGTPCSGPDCIDETARYKMFDSQGVTDNLSTTETSWLSCGTQKANPNAARAGNKSWILYDFSKLYVFHDTRVWNYNVPGETGKGFRNVNVDYSTDGKTWQPIGNDYTWPQAPGSHDYAGFEGPNMNDVRARYILVSAKDNWGDATCTGFSKITFNASLCDVEGTACDDGDPLTQNDKFDNNCNCKGVSINCATDLLALQKSSITSGDYKAARTIVAQTTVSTSSKDISFTAGNSIVLLPGFEVNKNSVFTADIAGCVQQSFINNQKSRMAVDDKTVSDFKSDTTHIDKQRKIVFRINQPSQVKLTLKDKNEKIITTLIDGYSQNLGTQIKMLPVNKLPKGEYWIELLVADKVLREKLEITE
ncbi:PA14 domain-containing protein [Emticicia sp. 21SJ11W-3]|uniref:PA14 domain-containing protein n=1 Tax=Emticicia sp. 21SJ11W-3 TaxID=2916755 RepID=UPI0020A152F7|nr:PA14 domain-containing protein [Emticicia sp. 21SJ11W-3]UTA68719.1 PA14 domain-containing protein [Emticicia sp. 21SJ11W-3]